jgi:hypothetical protein
MFKVHLAALCLVSDGRLLNAAKSCPFVTFGPHPVTAEMSRTMVEGHAKTHDLEPVHQ